MDGSAGMLIGNLRDSQFKLYKHWRGGVGTPTKPALLPPVHGKTDGHGGGDEVLFDHVIRVFAGVAKAGAAPLATIDNAVESHLLAWAAEESRRTNKVIDMTAYRSRIFRKAEALMERRRR